jgi:hypothetical protein
MTGAHTAGPTPEPAPTPPTTPPTTPPPAPQPTPQPAPQPAPRRPRRSLAWRVATPLVGILSGALFVVSAADSRGTDLRPGRYTDLAGLAEAEAGDYEEVRQDLE